MLHQLLHVIFSTMFAMIAAGVTALPSLLLGLAVAPIMAVLSLVPLALLVFQKPTKKSEATACNVIITGGSSGIGLAIAKECSLLPQVKRITLIARNLDKLNEAKASLEASGVEIQVISACVTDSNEVEKISQQVEMEETTYLLPCAGVSHPGYFSELSPQVFENQIKLNYLGTVHVVKAFLPRMKRGCITLVSSGAGQIGILGYSAYSPSKFALRGFAECLHMELVASPIHVQIAFPNDTKTPGYEQEQNLKPIECHLMSEAGGLLEPKQYVWRVCFWHECVFITHPLSKCCQENGPGMHGRFSKVSSMLWLGGMDVGFPDGGYGSGIQSSRSRHAGDVYGILSTHFILLPQ
jgi:3-dehydrosphinganine reductase